MRKFVYFLLIIILLSLTINGCASKSIESADITFETVAITESIEPALTVEQSTQNDRIDNNSFMFSDVDYIGLLLTDNEYATLGSPVEFPAGNFRGIYYTSSSGSIRLINYIDQSSGNTAAIFLSCGAAYQNSSHNDIFLDFRDILLDYCGVDIIESGIDLEVISLSQGSFTTTKNNDVSIEYLWNDEIMLYKIYPADTQYDIASLPLTAEGSGDILFNKMARETLKNYNENYQYDEMIEFIDSYINEGSPSESDNAFAIKSIAEINSDLLSKCDMNKDKVTDESIIFYEGIDEISSKNYIVPLIEDHSPSVWLGFHASDWIFFEDIEIKIDGSDNYKTSFNYYDISRDVDDGVTEKIKVAFPFDQDVLNKFLNTENPIIRFIGEHDKVRDHEVTVEEIDALATIFQISENYKTISNTIFRFE